MQTVETLEKVVDGGGKVRSRVGREFFSRNAVVVARDLLGKMLVRRFDDGREWREVIWETEAYCGEEDLACHASRGKTSRTEVMYEAGGLVYVYLIYGKYWLLNLVTGSRGRPEAVLIRSTHQTRGPGRLGNKLGLDKSFYGENLELSQRLWVEERGNKVGVKIRASERIGVEYAGEWAKRKWRFELS